MGCQRDRHGSTVVRGSSLGCARVILNVRTERERRLNHEVLLWIQKLGPGNCWDTKEEGRGGSSQEPERELTREKQIETLE